MYQGLAYEIAQAPALVAAAGLYVSLCTIKQRGGEPGDPPVDSFGQPDIADFTPITGLVNLPCMLGIFRLKPDIAAVTRLQDRFDTLAEREVLIDGYYPQILQRNLANVDGTDYEIMSVEADSQHTFTRLAVRLFNL